MKPFFNRHVKEKIMTNESQFKIFAKMAKEEKYKHGVIVTHDGIFHGDDVLAVAMLTIVYPDAYIERTRDLSDLPETAILVDVGGGEFDHHHNHNHQERDNGYPYAASGLVWRAAGNLIIQMLADAEGVQVTLGDVTETFNYVDKFVQEVDRHDCTGERRPESFSSIISMFNGGWEDKPGTGFEEAVSLAKTILKKMIKGKLSLFKARGMMDKVIEENLMTDILVLPKFIPWQSAVGQHPKAQQFKFVIFPTEKDWMIQTIKNGPSTYRVNLPSSWWGESAEVLQQTYGLEDAVFVHKNGFIAANKTLHGALEMAKLAIEANQSQEVGDEKV